MEIFDLLIRFYISSLLISSALDKWKNYRNHIGIVKDYNLIKESWIKPLTKMEIAVELIIGSFIFSGFLTLYSTWASIFLFFIYSLAISINLIKGRTELNCGCGGLSGHKKISWLLFLRNLSFIILLLVVIKLNYYIGAIDGLFLGLKFEEIYRGILANFIYLLLAQPLFILK